MVGEQHTIFGGPKLCHDYLIALRPVVGDKRASQGPIMSSGGPVTKRIRIIDPAKQVSRGVCTHPFVVYTR